MEQSVTSNKGSTADIYQRKVALTAGFGLLFMEAGKVTPAIERTYRLDEVPDAIRHFESGRTRGKAVISVGT